MTVCYFGIYNPQYSRNWIIIEGLRQNGVDVVECNCRMTGNRKYFQLIGKFWKVRKQFKTLVIGFPGQTIMPLAWLLARLFGKRIIFDAFVSQYLSLVEDRRLYRPRSLKGGYLRLLDRYSCILADLVLLDTQAQIDYFISKFGLRKIKFLRIFVGADNSVYFPKTKENQANKFIVHWHGYIVPFYSVETIINAADILKTNSDIIFRIICKFDRSLNKIKAMAKKMGLNNIEFIPEVSRNELAEYINQADVCLGIFGKNLKAGLVIPNKIYEAVACAKPVITANFKVINEVFDSNSVILCQPEDPEDLAKKIITLKNNSDFKNNISETAYEVYRVNLTPEKVVFNLINVITNHETS